MEENFEFFTPLGFQIENGFNYIKISLHICNQQQTKFHSPNSESRRSMEENFEFFTPLGIQIENGFNYIKISLHICNQQ